VTGGISRDSAREAWAGARSRVERLQAKRVRRRTATLVIAGACVVGVAIVVASVLGPILPWSPGAAQRGLSAEAQLSQHTLGSLDGSSSAAASSAATGGVDVEVPNVVGKQLKVAEAVITGAGFLAQTRVADPPVAGIAPDTVTAQWPESGALVAAGSAVVLTYQPRAGVGADADAPVVVIDAGHQQKANLELEPIGPGSKITKPKVAGGATGVSTGVEEYQRTLEIALKLEQALVAKGIKVVMVRRTSDVDIPNSERATIGNDANADLVIRLHCDTSADTTKRGISTLCPGGTSWVTKIEASSLDAANAVQSSVTKSTGAVSLGVFPRDDMSGFNFSKRPVIMVLMGFMSNADEDQKLGTPAYQAKMVSGLTDGIMSYLKDR